MNFCDKPHINQLTAILKAHHLQDIVVCPGSRNGILVHNFNAADFRLHPVTDERSAGFVALGLCLSKQNPVALCVTSGSALLNTIPAVAEAWFRQLPLLIISADRPKQWIGQLDGQTLPQAGALMPYTETFTLEKAHSESEQRWNSLRLNEAILSLNKNTGRPVHINVPISEPLFTFNTPFLPEVHTISEDRVCSERPIAPSTLELIKNAKFPILVIGQYEKGILPGIEELEKNDSILILPELISNQNWNWRTTALEHLLPDFDFQPDLVIHIGNNFVNKQLKLHLRRLKDCKVVRIDPTEQTPDTFTRLTTIVRGIPENAISQLEKCLNEGNTIVKKYKKDLDTYQLKGKTYRPSVFSDLGVLQILSQQLPENCALQVANSSVIRNATYFLADKYQRLFCNRGTNGIEGSLSAATGYALGYQGLTLSLIGDLSFFYDQNALWNTQKPNNLRILLFNNSGGQIFYRLPGLDQTPALSPYIAASHQTSAEGIAKAHGLHYLSAHNYQETTANIKSLLATNSYAPILLEVFTQTADNEKELKQIKQYYKTL